MSWVSGLIAVMILAWLILELTDKGGGRTPL